MFLEKFQLPNKVALITGGNRGLGAAMTIALAEAGADIAVVCRKDPSEIRKQVEDCGRKFLHISADLYDHDCIDRIVDSVLEEYGHIDILINNAGINIRKSALEFDYEEWNRILRINLDSLFILCQRVAKEFIKQGTGGKIISTASIVSFHGGLNNAPYTASKNAVVGLTQTLCNEWGKYGICVNAIAPGYMRTDLTEEIFQNTERRKQINARIPAGRWGSPEDLGALALFLASSASDYVNGAIIPVDGGWLSY